MPDVLSARAQAHEATPGVIRTTPLILTTLIMLRFLVGLSLGFRPFDDTYITFRYAKNLVAGGEFVYNTGEQILGTTTPLWTIVLALLARLHLDIESSAFLASLTADALSLVTIFLIVRTVSVDESLALGATFLFSSLFDALSLARAGMETSLFGLLLLLSVWALVGSRFQAAVVWSSLASLTRPEGLGMLILVFTCIPFLKERPSPHVLSRALTYTAMLVGGWSVFATAYFGSPIPHTLTAKAAHVAADQSLMTFSWMNLGLFFVMGQYGGGVFARSWVQMNLLLFTLSLIGVGSLLIGLVRRSGRAECRTLAGLAAYPAAYLLVLALTHAFTWFPWYYGPIYPFVAILGALGAWHCGRVIGSRVSGIQKTVCFTLLGVVIAGQLLAALMIKIPSDRDFWVPGYRQAAAGIPKSAQVVVAAAEIGTVGWTAWPARIVDLAGLITPAAVGARHADTLKHVMPDYLCVRTDDSGVLLAEVEDTPWFRSSYAMIRVVKDPFADREFRLYRRTGAIEAR